MANKYSKKNLRQEEKKQQPLEHRKGFGKGARVLAIVMIGAMLIFTVLAAGLLAID